MSTLHRTSGPFGTILNISMLRLKKLYLWVCFSGKNSYKCFFVSLKLIRSQDIKSLQLQLSSSIGDAFLRCAWNAVFFGRFHLEPLVNFSFANVLRALKETRKCLCWSFVSCFFFQLCWNFRDLYEKILNNAHISASMVSSGVLCGSTQEYSWLHCRWNFIAFMIFCWKNIENDNLFFLKR